MKVLHITSLYPSNCSTRKGQAVKMLIDSIDPLSCYEIENMIYYCIPFSCFPITILDSEWKCLAELRKSVFKGNVRAISSIVFPKSKFRKFCAINKAKRVLKQIKKKDYIPNIVHCHSAFSDGYSGYLLKQKNDIPYAVTVRREIDFENNNLNDKEKDFTLRNIKEASAVIAPSIHLKNKCIEHSGKKAILVPNGIDAVLVMTDLELIRKQNVKRDIVRIITVASLDTNKRVDIVIRCFSRLLKKFGNFAHLNIVGAGPLEEELKEMVRVGRLTSNVTFHGQVTNQTVIQIMNRCDVFFLPSETETFGLAYLEALARGLPVIGRKNQGIDGIAINGVHGFFENENEAFYEALETLSRNKDLRNQMGKKGVELARNCTWEKSGQKLAKIYENIKLGE